MSDVKITQDTTIKVKILDLEPVEEKVEVKA